MLYELRIYSVVPGRIADTLARYVDMPRIFARSGIDNVGRWVATAGSNAPGFLYMMAYRDFSEREAQWDAFYKDDEWWAYRTLTNAGEEMTDRYDILFLKPNPAWQPDPAKRGDRVGGIHELIIAEMAIGQTAVANDYFSETFLPLAEAAGAQVMMVADVVSGINLPKQAIMLAWPNAAARHRGRTMIDNDPVNLDAIRRQRQERGRAAHGKTETWLLEPTDFLLPFATLGNPRP